jgi:hypothetical protein
MRLVRLALLLAIPGCATTSHLGSGGPGEALESKFKVQRVETGAGAFLVRESVSADFKRLLAGEATQYPYFAAADR